MSGSPATVRGHVLVAEDNPVLAQLLTCQLIDAGYQVTCIADGQEVVDRIESLNPSLMVLDLGLPTLDGFGVLAVLQQSFESGRSKPPPPIIVVSGRSSGSDRRRAAELGAVEMLIKPYDCEDLLGAIARRTLSAISTVA